MRIKVFFTLLFLALMPIVASAQLPAVSLKLLRVISAAFASRQIARAIG